MLPQESSQKAIPVLASIHMSFTPCPFPLIMILPLQSLPQSPDKSCIHQYSAQPHPQSTPSVSPLPPSNSPSRRTKLSALPPFYTCQNRRLVIFPSPPPPFPQPPPPAPIPFLPLLPSMNINLVYFHHTL